MRVHKLAISGFRGLKAAELCFGSHCVLVGPNGCGKSSVVDALALVLGRARIVRALTEHDFFGSKPAPADRIRIVASLVGFADDDPDHAPDWFRAGRAVPKWADDAGVVHASRGAGRKLCAEIGFAARFDHEELAVETIRYFHDGGDDLDPFDEARPIEQVPTRLLNELGFFVLPARRGWEGTVSFASEFFRKTVSNTAGLPAGEILAQRDLVRDPPQPIETSPQLSELVTSMNAQLARLLIEKPEFKLRLTSGDSEGILQALLPHYSTAGLTLPVSRHGTGLLSLQTFLLLLEVGRVRRKKGLSFMLALEEPELHLAPGLQGRLVADAISIADQTVCTTHAPGVALMYPATSTMVMAVSSGTLSAAPVLAAPLDNTATNDERKLYYQGRSRLVSALMHPYILVPEGRFDWEWLERLASCAEPLQKATPFSTVFGIAPTENGGVKRMTEIARRLRPLVLSLTDGDAVGDGYADEIAGTAGLVEAVVQWPSGWTIEDAVGWVVQAGEKETLSALSVALDGAWTFATVADLVRVLKEKNDTKSGSRGLKEDLIAHDAVVATLSRASLARAALLLDALTSVALGLTHQNYVLEQVGPPRRARLVAS
jgi:energy-coupling factor transporter ATP-binding protein EcfA2